MWSDQALGEFAQRLKRAADQVPELPLQDARHSSFDTLWSGIGAKKRRHALQESAIISHLDSSGLLATQNFLELGCGVASFSYHLARLVPGRVHLLLDRQSFRSRRRFDYRFKELGSHVERFTTDICSFTRAQLRAEQQGPICVMSKHFCGYATDVALSLLVDEPQLSFCMAVLLNRVCFLTHPAVLSCPLQAERVLW
jgi:hypothetical protein